MNKQKAGILIENIEQLNRLDLQAAENIWIVPGSYRVEAEALIRGYKCFSGNNDVARGIPDDVMHIIDEVKNQVSGGFVNSIISGMLLRIFKHKWLSYQERIFGGEIKVFDRDSNFGGHGWSGIGSFMQAFEGGLDFTTNSLYINRDPLHYKKVVFKSDDFWGFNSCLRNVYNSIFKRGNSIYIPVYIDKAKDADSRWLVEYNYQNALMEAYFRALLSALRSAKKYPSIACFNYGTIQNIGIAKALSCYDIPVRLDSHGCMVHYGVGSISEIRALLSKNIYNDFPGVTEVCTRSPLQSKDIAAGKKNIIEPLLRGYKRNVTMGNIRVGYAPNFLPLYGNYHGLVPSCYDVMKTSELLIREFSADKRFELHVRIKTHVGKLPKNFDLSFANIDRGIAPVDLEGLINSSSDNVIDDSFVEYSDYLDNVDVIITSGVTSVVFDALERRIPVLFYSANENNLSPLPVEDFNSVFFAGDEFLQPVYWISDLKCLRPGLVKLFSKIDSPNFIRKDNKVLSKFIWVN